jgi:hypothetical protein
MLDPGSPRQALGRSAFPARAPRWRATLVAAALVTLALVSVFGASADAVTMWRFEPALAPPPPSGQEPAPYPVPLGQVGQISFWAPNRGLLITGGSGPVPPGLYAYNGANWHQLSSVCGGDEGRIAWAGPDEFWTISDQRAGQVTSEEEYSHELESVSLCHFQNGEVVGSYAMQLDTPESYVRMDAAACLAPSDCWFAGYDGRSPNSGSFHLHWNGSSVTASYDTNEQAVTGMASFGGLLEEGLEPLGIRSIAPAGHRSLCGGGASPFCEVDTYSEQQEKQLPVYPATPKYQQGVPPEFYSGFELSTDGVGLGSGASQLWAGADPEGPCTREGCPAIVLHESSDGAWTQVTPAPSPSGASALPPEAELAGSSRVRYNSRRTVGAQAIAPVPGTESAWVSLTGGPSLGGGAAVALLEADGKLAEPPQLLPSPLDPLAPVGNRGEAGPIVCPDAQECWMATSKGWLFHLSNGETHLATDTDPNFNKIIAFRPADDGLPAVYPDEPPEDDSLANQLSAEALVPPIQTPAPSTGPGKRGRALVTHIHSRLEHHHVMVLSFTLTARAHVRLIARRHGHVVAETPNRALRVGKHTLSLTLSPANWPTALKFQATPIGAPAPASSSGPSAAETITT